MSNAKSVKPVERTLNIGDKTYIIKFTLNSFIVLEDLYGSIEEAMKKLEGEKVIDEKTGLVVMEPLKDDNGQVVLDEDGNEKTVEKRNLSFKVIRNVLYAGLISAQPDITTEDVGNFEIKDFKDVMKSLMDALTGSLPQAKEENQKN